jgi:1-phosphofructokinase
MKITTVSLNPAIDQIVWMDHLRVDTVNRGKAIQFEPGGKGVNVALFLADYASHSAAELEVAVTGFLGSENAQIFEQCFMDYGIADHFIRLPGQTRLSVKIVDEAAQQTTDINMPGLEPSLEAVEQLIETIHKLADDSDWFVLTGSLPPGLPADIYARMIEQLSARGRNVILDSSQAALCEGVRACPAIIKPNFVELQDLAGKEIAGQADLLAAVRPLIQSGIKLVVVSLGEQGALFAIPGTCLRAIPPRILIKSTVGAGDALVAGILCAQVQGLNLEDCARLATAFSVSVITRTARGLPNKNVIEDLASQVRVETIRLD